VGVVGFVSEDEAKHFLIQAIAARAIAEGCPLSEDERRMLVYSAGVSDSPPESCAGEADEYIEGRMPALLRRSYEDQGAGQAQQLYREAFAALSGGDHYLNWVVDLAGLGPPMPEWLRRVKRMGRVVLLVMPGLAALLIAGAGLWAALGRASESPDGRIGMGVVAFVFAGFGAFLLALWHRERRG